MPIFFYLDKIPPWTAGWSVFTLPPRISGAPEISETSLIASPASRNILAVPPLPTRVKPKFFKFFPSSTRPILFETDNSAVKIELLLNKSNFS